MGDWIWLLAGFGLVAVVEGFVLLMDWREKRKPPERAWPRLVPTVEREPPPPIDFTEALRRRGRR